MRLIDADKLKKELRITECSECKANGSRFCKNDCYVNKFCDLLDKQSTIENIINAKDFKKRLNNMQYVYLQACYEDLIDAIDCEVTYFKEKMNNGKK